MNFGARSALALMTAAGLVLAACGKGSSPAPAGATATVPPAPQATAQPTAAPQAGIDALGLVYVDRRAGPSQLFLARGDGSSPKPLGTLASGTRALDIAGPNLLLAASDSLTVMNLAGGTSVKVPTSGNVTFASLVGDTGVLYAVVSGCGPPGPPASRLMLADLKTQQSRQVLQVPSGNLTIVGIDASGANAAIAPRGCDVTTSEIDLVKLADGSMQKYAVQGCGWVAYSFEQRKALASWRSCNAPAAHQNADATLYDFATNPPPGKDVQGPGGGANQNQFLVRPGGSVAAMGAMTKVAGPGGSQGAGVWLMDLSNQLFELVGPAAGAEQSPVAWSADGRYLLFETVQAQGLCSFSYLDMNTRTVKPISADVTFCGANGDVIGWAVLR